MKDKIHPKLFDVNVHCACGNEFPGKQKLMDTAGRVEKFNRKYGKKAEVAATEAEAPAAAPAEEAPAVDAQ
jgi:large subunit ribosomal protein L31